MSPSRKTPFSLAVIWTGAAIVALLLVIPAAIAAAPLHAIVLGCSAVMSGFCAAIQISEYRAATARERAELPSRTRGQIL